ncbi:MAG: phosphoribosylanthranilate isomerase [Burkholderiaceae bacterium]
MIRVLICHLPRDCPGKSSVTDTDPSDSFRRTRVKLCGLKTASDVLAAVQAGADAIGFVVYEPSPRHVSPAEAHLLARDLPPWVQPVLLFVDAEAPLVQSAVANWPNVMLQFHGQETDAYCRQFDRPYIKALAMRAGVNLQTLSTQYPQAQALLLDAPSAGHGGAGKTFDWSLLAGCDRGSKPLILSGGLQAENVGRAIAQIKPYAVDVSSGIELIRGVKCLTAMRRFCRAVTVADAQFS